jgi:hypothetical protein
MSRAARVFALVFAAGLVALLCVGLVERRSEAFTLGVQPVTPLYARAGSTVCQGPIEVVEDFSAVRLTIGAAVVSSPPGRVEVLDAGTNRRLATGTLRSGYPSEAQPVRVDLAPIQAGRRIRICLHVTGRSGLLVYGNADAAARGTTATLNGRPRQMDLDIVFLREDKASVLALTGAIMRRAALFHCGWVGTWTIWLLAILAVTAFPALLGLAIRRAGESEDQPTASASE